MMKSFVMILISIINGALATGVFCTNPDLLSITDLTLFNNNILPSLNGTRKGDSGRIGIIGGSTEYTGAPFFAAITALKVGADLVYVISTPSASPVIKSYSPDLIVYPFLDSDHFEDVKKILKKLDIVVIGPGLGRTHEIKNLVAIIIQACREMKTPLIIDADGLEVITENNTLIQNYPTPGVIMTPNHREASKLKYSVEKATEYRDHWYTFWGENVFVLEKGETDTFHNSDNPFNWQSKEGGSGRRVSGQGDILSGALGTFYNWSLKGQHCDEKIPINIAASSATFAAAKLTRMSNAITYESFGRSMTTTDMLNNIHVAFRIMCPNK